MFKTFSSSSSLVITSRWFATSRLVAPVSVTLVYYTRNCLFHINMLVRRLVGNERQHSIQRVYWNDQDDCRVNIIGRTELVLCSNSFNSEVFKASKLVLRMVVSGIHALQVLHYNPDNKVHGTNMGPTLVLSAPDGPHEPYCYQG